MKKLFFILLCVGTQAAMSQTKTSFFPKTGDNGLDSSLSEINAHAKADLSAFKNKLNKEFGIAVTKVDQMLKTMQPADAYMCCEVSHVAAKPVETVQTCYEKNKGKGWGEIAKEMGIKPGSKEFHELKNKAKNKNDKDKGEKGKGNGKSHGQGQGQNHGQGKGKNNDNGKVKGKGEKEGDDKDDDKEENKGKEHSESENGKGKSHKGQGKND